MSLPQRFLNRVFHRREPLHVQFLTRPGCHLCEEAEAQVRREFGEESVERINILDHPDLEQRYVFRIPVILYENGVIAEGELTRHVVHQARRRACRIHSESRTAS